MPRQIRFIELELINYTNQRSQMVRYGDVTRLSGCNGQGKTSIGSAPVWIFWGIDLLGKTFNPSPTNYTFDRVLGSLLLSVDGMEIKLAREIEKGKNAFYINDVPKPAKAFDEMVASLFDKELFLSFYNPAFFFTQHWTKQREQIMQHATPPPNSEVFAEMSRGELPKETPIKGIPFNPQATKLAELVKNHSIDDLDGLHKKRKVDMDTAYKKAQGAAGALRNELAALPDVDPQGADVLAEKLTANEGAITAEEERQRNARDNNDKIFRIKTELKNLVERANSAASDHKAKKAEPPASYKHKAANPPADKCNACGQLLDEESRDKANQAHAAELDRIMADHNVELQRIKKQHEEILSRHKTLKLELADLEPVDIDPETIRDLHQNKTELTAKIHAATGRAALSERVKAAELHEQETLTLYRESVFILDAIKAYRAKEAELQVAKVQSLFTSLTVRLHKYVKSKDEYEPDFSLQMDGKDYSSLSAGEKIAAGLELHEVLYKQWEMITPCFIDGIGEYTGKVLVYGQLITGRAVPDQELKIETEELSNGK